MNYQTEETENCYVFWRLFNYLEKSSDSTKFIQQVKDGGWLPFTAPVRTDLSPLCFVLQ